MLVLFDTVKTKMNGMLYSVHFLVKYLPLIFMHFMPPWMPYHHYWWISKTAKICIVEFDLPGHIWSRECSSSPILISTEDMFRHIHSIHQQTLHEPILNTDVYVHLVQQQMTQVTSTPMEIFKSAHINHGLALEPSLFICLHIWFLHSLFLLSFKIKVQ